MTDDQLCRVYVDFDVPSDQIAQNTEYRATFVAQVRAATTTTLDDDAIIDRLIYLRKQGWLPRLRR